MSGFQSQTFWGFVSPVQILRFCVPIVGLFTPHSSGKNSIFVRALPLVGHYAGAGVFDETVSLPLQSLLMCPFSPCCAELFS